MKLKMKTEETTDSSLFTRASHSRFLMLSSDRVNLASEMHLSTVAFSD